jgi:hypothetical protein
MVAIGFLRRCVRPAIPVTHRRYPPVFDETTQLASLR